MTTTLDLTTLHLAHGAHSNPQDGACLMHNGRLLAVSESQIRRFESHVDVTDSCHLWTAGVMHRGYGIFNMSRVAVRAHRFSFQVANGPITDLSQVVDHLCGQRLCVRVDHLELVTPRENVMRSAVAPAQINAMKAVCPQGHPIPATTFDTEPAELGDVPSATAQQAAAVPTPRM